MPVTDATIMYCNIPFSLYLHPVVKNEIKLSVSTFRMRSAGKTDDTLRMTPLITR